MSLLSAQAGVLRATVRLSEAQRSGDGPYIELCEKALWAAEERLKRAKRDPAF